METRSRAARIAGYVAMVLVLLVVALPLYWVIVTSLKPADQVYTSPPAWLPHPPTAGGYSRMLADLPIGDYFRNSLVITGVLAAIKIVLGVLSAYAFVFLRFPGRGVLFVVVLAALMVPNQITVISNYALISQLGWTDTFQGIIVPLAGVAVGTFLMRNHFQTLPREIIEAARIDGLKELSIFARIYVPTMKSTFAAAAVITFMASWNNFLWPRVILLDNAVQTMPMLIANLTAGYVTDYGVLMLAVLLTSLPTILIFLILQRTQTLDQGSRNYYIS